MAVGGELTSDGSTEPRIARATRADIFMAGTRIMPRVYHIGGSNYFMLAELTEALGFTATWDRAAQAIRIFTH